MQLLGDQLIGTPRLAIFELVKNAYDADATVVNVSLERLNSENASITIQDDGEGMNFDTIRDVWLVPAHDHREVQRASQKRTELGRLPLGEKGLGRFAVHKLGDRIELVTRARNSEECVVVIDWDRIIENKYLSEVGVDIEVRKKPLVFLGKSTGTRLVVKRLREKEWTRGEVRRLRRQVTSISSPFKKPFDDFEATVEVPGYEQWLENLPDVPELIGRAPWTFSFKFEEGKISWKYEFKGIPGIKLASRKIAKENQALLIAPERDSDSLGMDQGKRDSKPKKIVADKSLQVGIGPIEGVFYVFDRDREVLSHLGNGQMVENILDESGGVRVYRDGIRVYNYGERGDDWLGLDLRRVNLPTRNISRNIVVGSVDLSLETSGALKEKTNREGFVESIEYTRLREIVLGAISIFEIERKIDKDNIRKLTVGPRDPEIEKFNEPLQKLREVAKKHRISKEIDPLVEKAERHYNEMRDTMLRAGLSGVGLAIVFHEIERGVRILHEAIKSKAKLELVQTQARELVHILDGFSGLLRKGDKRGNSLKQLVRRARDINSVRFRNHKVKFVCPFLEERFDDIEVSFAFNLMLGAINNILDNAFYWLRVRWPDGDGPDKKVIFINVEKSFSGGPAVIIADNGPGFQDNPERLTRPFFSRRPDGMGVGLYYTNMVMELNAGTLLFPERGELEVPEVIDGAMLALTFNQG